MNPNRKAWVDFGINLGSGLTGFVMGAGEPSSKWDWIRFIAGAGAVVFAVVRSTRSEIPARKVESAG